MRMIRKKPRITCKNRPKRVTQNQRNMNYLKRFFRTWNYLDVIKVIIASSFTSFHFILFYFYIIIKVPSFTQVSFFVILVCAAACFCTELVLFLQEYQYLKFLVTRSCTPSNRELSSPPTPNFVIRENGHISFPGPSKFLSANGLSLPLPSPSFVATTTPCTKSIAETVTAASWIPFPYELKLDYKIFYDTYLDPNSDLAINFSGNLLGKIKGMIKRDQYDLSMYEQAREEVLILLYVNTFEKFLKMFGTDVKSKIGEL